MSRARRAPHASRTVARTVAWLVLALVAVGHLYARTHGAFERHVQCAEHPGEWTHDDGPAHEHDSHSHGPTHPKPHEDDEHGHCAIVQLNAPSAQPVDVAPAPVEIAAVASAPTPAPCARFLATTPLLRLAPKTSPPTNC